MTQPAEPITDADASILWRQLSESLDRLIAAWSAGEPPRLGDYLPVGPAVLRRMTLVELVKVDLEQRWRDPRWYKRIEDYLAEFPELATNGAVPCDVIYEEYHVRRTAGDAVSLTEYCDRFPTRADELRRLAAVDHGTASGSATLSSSRPPSFEPGQRLDDFDLLAVLGRGAFAAVFLANQRSMQRRVALKISAERGFEHQTLAQLDHPNIVRVYDHRLIPERKLRLLYMQYVAGGTLQEVIAYARSIPRGLLSGRTYVEAIDAALVQRDETPPRDSLTRYRLQQVGWGEVVCWVGARLASALAYAHVRGVLHRDVKPANVLVATEGHPLVADFNISFSKLDGATPAAYFGGSLAYMSPEQLEACDPAHHRQAGELDARSDIFSLGVLLWEMLTLARPFSEEGLPSDWAAMPQQLAERRYQGVPQAALARVPSCCPPGLVDVLLKCLASEPGDRFASAEELAQALDLCLQPRAQALLRPQQDWTGWLKRHAFVATIVLGLLPNILMSGLNIAYNETDILNGLSVEDQQAFYSQLVAFNAVAYLLGLAYVCVTRRKLFEALKWPSGSTRAQPPVTDELVESCLTLGLATAGVTAALWTMSGLAFPAWIYLRVGHASGLAPGHVAHFFASNLLCGLIAATQSYYVVTLMSVRFCYPRLLQHRAPEASDLDQLVALMRRARIFLALSVSVPLLALVALVLISFDRIAIAGLCGLGLLGCGLAYALESATAGDVSALAAMFHSSGDSLLTSHSADTLFGNSRRR